jgi:hypothetical protein
MTDNIPTSNKRKKYKEHKGSVANRIDKLGNPIEFRLSFEEWDDIWSNSGKWDQRGVRKGQYCMSRYNDIGHYEVSNVYIQETTENTRQHNAEYTHSSEVKQKIKDKRQLQVIPKGKANCHAKSIMTPNGVFDTIKDAGVYYGCTPENIGYRLKKHPTEYFVV